MATKPKSTKKPDAPAHDEFWGQMAEEIPRADVLEVSKAARRIKMYRWYVRANLILLPVAVLGVLTMLPKMAAQPPVQLAPVSEISSPTKAAAMQAVNNWLGSYPAPLPTGKLLSWDGVKVQQEPEVGVDPVNGQPVEKQGLQLHTLTLVADNGTLFTTTVQVAYSPVRGAQVIGSPALMPRAPDDTGKWNNLTSWPNLATVQAPDPVKQSAEAWVKAFTSGDPATLRLAVHDEEASHAYVPLTQANYTDVRVEEAGAAKKVEGDGAVENATQLVARVSFAVAWDGIDVDKNRAGTPPRMVYDVLINQAETASPVIVAWGGAGTGESLKAYQNAVIDRAIEAESLTGPTDSRVIATKAQAVKAQGTAPVTPKATTPTTPKATPTPTPAK